MIVNKQMNGFKLALDIDAKGISKRLYANGVREKAFMSILDQEVKDGYVCVDLGANIGYTTMTMAKNVGDTGIVYAIEPDKRSHKLLTKSIALNGFEDRCQSSSCAISDKDGTVDFGLAAMPNTSGIGRGTSTVKVQALTLGSFMANKRFPNMIKMDIEGHEVSVLSGAEEYFRNNAGNVSILMEVHPTFYSEDNNLATILQRYFDMGFSVKYVVATPVARPTLFKDKGYSPIKTFQTDGFERGIYNDITPEDTVAFACYNNEQPFVKDGKNQIATKIVRSIMITREV